MSKFIMILCIISSYSVFAEGLGYSGHVYGYGETKESAIKDGKQLAHADGCYIQSVSVEYNGGRYKASIAVSDCEDDNSDWPY